MVSEIYIETETHTCVYPSSPALALGIVAAVFAIIARIYISVSFGGSGCCRNGPNSTPISKLFFVLSWVASVGAVLLLLAAAGLNNRRSGQIDSYDYIKCYVVKPGIFAVGAVLALINHFPMKNSKKLTERVILPSVKSTRPVMNGSSPRPTPASHLL
ncbi:hypothetical protein L6452_25252 [Arctium lappa]|uniref:Uncharacterized protein n=1 Tax=Arctium lappa TaxID=4217 RepID=A0ACB9AAP4_ARCLA|nr:hypothetical protein L6452_25252 [Arctium lappa]